MWWMVALALAGPSHFVQASSLKLRAGPSPSATVQGTLTINSPVEVLSTEGGFARVRVGNGKEGWVSERFLATDKLTVAAARAKAEADPAGALAWWQRAAAMAPGDREVLAGLAVAYRAAGEDKAAALVDAQLAWPYEVLVVARSHRWRAIGDNGIVVQWEARPQPWQDHLMTAAERAKKGIPETGWWVLPDIGAPVAATVREAWSGYHNECAGTEVLEIVLDAALPEGTVALAATRGTPPASWTASSSVPGMERAVAAAAVEREAVRRAAGTSVRHGVSWDGSRWIGRILLGDGEPGDTWTVVEVAVGADGGVKTLEERAEVFDGYLELGRRDIDGDGVVERVLGDGCMTMAIAVGSEDWEVFTDNWCCGC